MKLFAVCDLLMYCYFNIFTHFRVKIIKTVGCQNNCILVILPFGEEFGCRVSRLCE